MKVISIVGYHKVGKTTLVERLVRELAKYGRVGTVKHTREEILPLAGDTERHLNAGAEVTIGVTQTRLVKIIRSTDLKTVLDQLMDEGLDFAVVEGFKESNIPKIGIGDVEAKNIIARVDIGVTGEELAKIAMEQPDHVTLEYLVARIKRSPRVKEAGAVGAFTGMARELPEMADARVPGRLDGMAKERLKKIEDDLKKLEGVLEVYVYYRAVSVENDGGQVHIVILSRHREELLPALEEAIERIKAMAPTLKKELAGSGDFWMHDLV